MKTSRLAGSVTVIDQENAVGTITGANGREYWFNGLGDEQALPLDGSSIGAAVLFDVFPSGRAVRVRRMAD
jgi:hypothetical protein